MSKQKTLDSRDSSVTFDDGPETAWEQNAQVVISTEMPKMEKIRFFNLRDPGREHRFFYSSKTHPLLHYTLLHDHEYDLPYEVIDLLEGSNPLAPESCQDFLYKDTLSPDGKMSKSLRSGCKSKFQCKRIRTR